jgi:large conductance mechanosensitive channel
MKDFKNFLLKGNLIDLAVAFVMGAAFTLVVTALVKDVITPFIAAIFGGSTQFADLAFTVNKSVIHYGDFLQALVNFVIVAAVIFFLVVRPVNHVMKRLGKLKEDAPVRDCPACLSSVPEAATKCAFCTSELAPAA